MSYDIIILDQIGNQVHLYINCFKYGYKTLCYFADPDAITEISLQSPEITITGLTDTVYYFYCKNNNEDETGYITVPVSAVSRSDLYQNIAIAARLENPVYTEIMAGLKTNTYITELADSNKIKDESIREELMSVACTYYNMSQELLNQDNTPSFLCNANIIMPEEEDTYTFHVYVYQNQKWLLETNKKRTNETRFVLYGEPCHLYMVCILSELQIIRKYFIYEPSEEVSKAIYENRIAIRQLKKEKTAENISRYDLSEISEDTYGQNIVSALQEIKPDRPLFKKPLVNYTNKGFTVTVRDWNLAIATGQDIYIGALEIDQAFAKMPAPHRIKVSGETTVFQPEQCLLNNHEDYLFFLCDKNDVIVSDPVLISYNTNSDLELYTDISRKIDIELFRRRLFSVFKEYDKQDWDMVSSYLDTYAITTDENSFLEYVVQKLGGLNIYQYNPIYILELVLLTQLKYYMPVDQEFLQEQVFAEGYRKHIFPEADMQYAICAIRINNGHVLYDYLPCGRYAQELRMDLDDILILYAIDGNGWRCSSIALYNNYNSEESPYLYFPDLEVNVLHGLN